MVDPVFPRWDANLLLPPANEVWGKVIFSEACVKNSVHSGGSGPGGGRCLVRRESGPGGCLVPGGVWSWGVPAQANACLGGSASGGGGAWWRPPRDGYCCGRYASYWNAFLFAWWSIILAENCTKMKKIGHGEGLMHAPRPTTSYILFKILAWGVPAAFTHVFSIFSFQSRSITFT